MINLIKKLISKYRIAKLKYKVHADWQDDLIWCPSQCEKHIEYSGNQYVIYLRWRWSDPWTAEIIKCNPDNGFDFVSIRDWHDLNVGYWKDTELDALKKEVEIKVKEWLLNNN